VFKLLISEPDRILARHKMVNRQCSGQALPSAWERAEEGPSRDLRDTMIADIVLAHHAALATRNA
jgi:predicted nucleic acid-binding protein